MSEVTSLYSLLFTLYSRGLEQRVNRLDEGLILRDFIVVVCYPRCTSSVNSLGDVGGFFLPQLHHRTGRTVAKTGYQGMCKLLSGKEGTELSNSHNPKVAGSNPAPATTSLSGLQASEMLACFAFVTDL